MGGDNAQLYVTISAVLVGEEKGGVVIASRTLQLALVISSVADFALITDPKSVVENPWLLVVHFWPPKVFVPMQATPHRSFTLRVLGSREGLRAWNTRHEPSPQSPLGEMATFFSSSQALPLDADAILMGRNKE